MEGLIRFAQGDTGLILAIILAVLAPVNFFMYKKILAPRMKAKQKLANPRLLHYVSCLETALIGAASLVLFALHFS